MQHKFIGMFGYLIGLIPFKHFIAMPHVPAKKNNINRLKLPTWELTSSPVMTLVKEAHARKVAAELAKEAKEKFKDDAWKEKLKLDRLEKAAKKKKAGKTIQKKTKFIDNPKL